MVSAEPSHLDPGVVGRAYRAVEPLHSQVYFAPEHDEYLTALGLEPGRMAYFAGRSAAMGAVAGGVVAATFFNFSPELIARHIPRAWGIAPPDNVVAARATAARASLTRLLGDAAETPDIAELAGLLREACAALTPEDRPLFAGTPTCPGPTSRWTSSGTAPRCCASTAVTAT
jgi:hypothetical protein